MKMFLKEEVYFVAGSRKKIYFTKKTLLGVILYEKSIARIPEPWKRFLDPDSGKKSMYWSENQMFSDFYEKTVDS